VGARQHIGGFGHFELAVFVNKQGRHDLSSLRLEATCLGRRATERRMFAVKTQDDLTV